MAITRQLIEIRITFTDSTGAVAVNANAIVNDDSEGTSTGSPKKFNAPQVVAAAEALRDEIVQQYAQQEKPVTF